MATGRFRPPVNYAGGSNTDGNAAIAVGDFTGNGRLDLAVANQGDGTVSVLLGNGDGTFQPPVTYAVGSSLDSIVAGDFTGDGRLDLAVGVENYNSVTNTYASEVSMLLGNGDGTFQPASNGTRRELTVPSWRVTSTVTVSSTWPRR